MPSLYTHQSSNIRKTWLLFTLFFGVVIGIGFVFSRIYGNSSILIFAVLFSSAMAITSYWYSDKLVLKMTHATPVTRENARELYNIVENLCITAGLPVPKIYVINEPVPNAFATGRDENHAVVCATTGLLSLMTRSELEGVIGHELSHIKNRDMLLMTVAVVLAGFVAILANIFLRMSSFGGGGRGSDNKNANALIMILAIAGIVLAPLAAKLIQLAISRRREYLADASGALLTRYPKGLASALEKIGNYPAPMRSANLATAHLFIGDPFSAGGGVASMNSRIEKLFSTHPPIQDRIKALLSQQA